MGLKEKITSVRWGAVLLENGELSMGRVMAWVVFGTCFWFWIRGQNLPSTMFDILLVLFAYNFGKKFTGPLAQAMSARLGVKAAPLIPASEPPGTVPTPHTKAPMVERLRERLAREKQAQAAPTLSESPKITYLDDPFEEDRP